MKQICFRSPLSRTGIYSWMRWQSWRSRSRGVSAAAATQKHTFNELYEGMLKDLQSAGRAGEFYTPRPVTNFIVEKIDPKLGETVLDPACGTGGFLTSTIAHMGSITTTEQLKNGKSSGRQN